MFKASISFSGAFLWNNLLLTDPRVMSRSALKRKCCEELCYNATREREREYGIRKFYSIRPHLKGCKRNKPCNAMHTQYSVCNVSSAWKDQLWSSDSVAATTENANRLGYKHVCVNYLHVASHDYLWIGPKAVGRPKSQGYWQWPENGNHEPGLHQSPGRTSGLNSRYLG